MIWTFNNKVYNTKENLKLVWQHTKPIDTLPYLFGCYRKVQRSIWKSEDGFYFETLKSGHNGGFDVAKCDESYLNQRIGLTGTGDFEMTPLSNYASSARISLS